MAINICNTSILHKIPRLNKDYKKTAVQLTGYNRHKPRKKLPIVDYLFSFLYNVSY